MSDTRTVLITGVTRGLGRAMMDRFVEAGWHVAGCGRSAEEIAGLSKRCPAPHRFDAVDVTDDLAVASWAKQVASAGLVPDLLLNNAAVMNRTAPLWEIAPDDFHRTIDVNINGVYHVLRHFVPLMIAAGRGVIVNFSSGWGRSTAPEVAPYCATKYAIEGLTLAMAAELPKGLAAVALNPGVIDTDMLRSCWSDGASAYPAPDEWSRTSVPFLMRLTSRHNGRSLDVGERL
jgi:NAD(P)-dependent dehydrogenase (short-subunit alcohol dehydrogenase family)